MPQFFVVVVGGGGGGGFSVSPSRINSITLFLFSIYFMVCIVTLLEKNHFFLNEP